MFPFSVNRYFHDTFHTGVNGAAIHIDYVLSLATIRVFNGCIKQFTGFVIRKNTGKVEECSLHNHIDASAKPDSAGNVKGIDDIEAGMEGSQFSLHGSREYLIQFFCAPAAVQYKGTARLQAFQQIILIDIGWSVAGNVVGVGNQIRLADWVRAETKVGNGYASGLSGVIGEIALCIHVRVIADNLDGILVGTDSTIGTKAPELAGNAPIIWLWEGNRSQGKMGYIIGDAKGKVMSWTIGFQMFKYSHNIFWNDILGAESITAANDADIPVRCGYSTLYIQIQRFANSTWFACAVQYGNLLYRFRKLAEEMLYRERTVQMNVHDTHLFAFSQQSVGDILGNIGNRADGNDDTFCILCAIIVKQMIVTAGQAGNVIHISLHNVRNSQIEWVGCFAMLEIYIRIFSGSADNRMVRSHGMFSETGQCLFVDQRFQFIIIEDFYLLDFMTGTESIKEIDEWYTAFDGCQMGNSGQIHNFLRIGFSQHGTAGSTGGHYVLMITENRKRMVG